jgi:hypothetical protein
VELHRQVINRSRASTCAGPDSHGARRGYLVVLLLTRDTAPPAEPATLVDQFGRSPL